MPSQSQHSLPNQPNPPNPPTPSRQQRHSIGVFDSGIGGLSVLAALRAELPELDFIYVADSRHAPYGERAAIEVLARSRRISAWLAEQGVSLLVLACNTATAAAIGPLRAEFPSLPMVGVEPALKPAALSSKTGHVGVLATRSTLESQRFQTLLAAQAQQARFTLAPCDGLADAIERSAISGDSAQTLALCQHYIGQMVSFGGFGEHVGAIDTLVLGCTHYPFASAQLQRLVPQVQLLSNGAAVARQARRLLAATGLAKNVFDLGPGLGIDFQLGRDLDLNLGSTRLVSTGQPDSLQAAASRWLGLSQQVQELAI